MSMTIYDQNGIRFEYPAGWGVEVSEDGSRVTVGVQAASGLAFAMVTLDEERPAAGEMADEALGAMREEYPSLEAVAAAETIDGHRAVGHDLEFVSLDVTNACAIRAFRTARRTVLIFAQWSDLDDEGDGEDDDEAAMATLRRSLEETDA